MSMGYLGLPAYRWAIKIKEKPQRGLEREKILKRKIN